MTERPKIHLPEDRFFGPDPGQKQIAQELYDKVKDLPLVCPHGHVDPAMFADPDYRFGSPTEMLIIPDHYIFRMLYSQGVALERLGVPRLDGGMIEQDFRQIWQVFANKYYLFQGTPTSQWLAYEFKEVFGVEDKLTSESAQDIYDQIAACIESEDFRPRKLFERFNIEVLCTTDAATDTLAYHQAIRESGWKGTIRPTFRPDAVVNMDVDGWLDNIERLSEVSGISITDYGTFIMALEQRRTFFKEMGATATDHAALTPYSAELSQREADDIFQRGLRGEATERDVARFTAHMLLESARMSAEDGLVMQLHVGSFRDHNRAIYHRFGKDKGADIPLATEFTRNLAALLNRYGNTAGFRLILFTLDETTNARELAPLAGHYPAVRLGPPWWFHDSLNGMARFFDQVIETAGVYNTAGFNDDTRAFPSIPARHDLWRRASANWVAGQVVRGIVDRLDAEQMIEALAYSLAKDAYRLG